ncbi:unnamed protein product [Caenorhabditis nigoni]
MSLILDTRSEIYKRTALFVYFNSGYSRYDAKDAIAIEFPETTVQEVVAWFDRFDAGNMDIGENISINAEGIVVDRSVTLKRGLEGAEQADGEPPARMNTREVDDENGTRQRPKGDGIRLVNQAVAQQQATPHDVPMVAVHQNPTNRGTPQQIEDPSARQDQQKVSIRPQPPVHPVPIQPAAVDSSPKAGGSLRQIMAEPVIPIKEQKLFRFEGEVVEPPTPEIDVSKWTIEETVDWVQQICPDRKDINAELLVKEGLSKTLLQDFAVEPPCVDLKKLLNLNHEEYTLLARQAAFLVNRSNRFTYPERVKKYQRDLEIWRKQNSQCKRGEEEKVDKEMDHGVGTLEGGLMRGTETSEVEDPNETAAEKIQKRRQYMAKVERFMAMEYGPKNDGPPRRIRELPVRPIYEKKLFIEGCEIEKPERFKEDLLEWTAEDALNWIHLICPHRLDIDAKRIESLNRKVVQASVASPARVAKLLNLNYTEHTKLFQQAALIQNRSNRAVYSERVRNHYRNLDICRRQNSQ